MKTNTTVISTEECSEFFGSTSVTGDHLCTTGADGHGVCGVIIKITLISGNVFCLQEDFKNGIKRCFTVACCAFLLDFSIVVVIDSRVIAVDR